MAEKLLIRPKQKALFLRFLIIFSLSSVGLAVIIAILFNLETKNYLSHIKLEEKYNINLYKKIIAGNFNLIISDLMFLSEQNELSRLLNSNEERHYNNLAQEYFKFSKNKGLYDQIRFLDETGMEIVRVNYNNGTPIIVPKDQLQFKGERYYFRDTIQLARGEVYLSQFDLNIEEGKVEKPLKPVIRFGTSVFDGNNQNRGIVILNYLGAELLKDLREALEISQGEIMLLNSEGYWLLGRTPSEEWGFMFQDQKDQKFGNVFPEQWHEISQTDSGQLWGKNGLFTFITVYPLPENPKLSTGYPDDFISSKRMPGMQGYYWKIVSRIPTGLIYTKWRQSSINLFIIYLVLLVPLGIASWFTAQMSFKRMLWEQHLRHLAHFDNLTGLPNRTLFFDRFDKILAQATRYNHMAGLLFIDLDGFKSVNDNMGHDAGNVMLHETAERLRKFVRKADTVARVGGDEFAIILARISSPEDAVTMAQKVIKAISTPFILKGQKASISASIGISLCPQDGSDTETLLRRADIAMYHSKKNAKNRYQFYSYKPENIDVTPRS